MNISSRLLLLVCCFSFSIASEDIFRPSVRTKRPNKLKEEIAQLCITTLEYSTELVALQAKLQQTVLAVTAHSTLVDLEAYSMLADIQRALYSRIRELADGDKNAYLNQATSRELQKVLNMMCDFEQQSKKRVSSLRELVLDLSKKGKNQIEVQVKIARIKKEEEELVALLGKESSFFSAGCCVVNKAQSRSDVPKVEAKGALHK